jgi:hypothetical protein
MFIRTSEELMDRVEDIMDFEVPLYNERVSCTRTLQMICVDRAIVRWQEVDEGKLTTDYMLIKY